MGIPFEALGKLEFRVGKETIVIDSRKKLREVFDHYDKVAEMAEQAESIFELMAQIPSKTFTSSTLLPVATDKPMDVESRSASRRKVRVRRVSKEEMARINREIASPSRAIDFVVRAIGKTGGILRCDELYDRATAEGHDGSGKNPRAVLRDKVRRFYKNLVEFDKDNDLYRLTDAGWKLFRNSTQPNESEPPRIETMDLLLKVLFERGGRSKTSDLVDPMLAAGWVTGSQTLANQKQNLWATAYKRPDLIARSESGDLVIQDNGYARLREMGVINEGEEAFYTA